MITYRDLSSDERYLIEPQSLGEYPHTILWVNKSSLKFSEGMTDYDNGCVWADMSWGGFNLIGLYDD